MKKIIGIFMITALALISSCSKDNGTTNKEASTMKSIAFNIVAEEYLVKSGEVDTPSRYAMIVYLNGEHVETLQSGSGSFDYTFDPRLEYKFAFWADNGDANNPSAGSYDISTAPNGYINLRDVNDITVAYYTSMNTNWGFDVDEGGNVNIEVRRIISEVNLIETGNSLTIGEPILVEYNTMSRVVILNNIDTPSSELIIRSITPEVTTGEVGTFYVIPNNNYGGSTIESFTFTHNSVTKEVNNVPIRANYITNIRGEFGTAEILPTMTFNTTLSDWLSGDNEAEF